MRKTAVVAVVVVLCGLLAPSARAQRFYIGASGGQANFDAIGATGTFSFSGTGFKGFAGVRFARFTSAEIAYTDLGTANGTREGESIHVTPTTWTGHIVGSLTAGPRVSLFAKAGYARWHAEVRSSNTSTTGGANDSGSGFCWGFGLGYNITRRFGLRVEWDNLGNFGDAENVKLVSAGIRFDF